MALVTGGASGIGFATAKLLAEEGAKVVVADLAGAGPDGAVAALAGTIHFAALDVTHEDQWIAATDTVVRDFGRLDVLVNSAGIA